MHLVPTKPNFEVNDNFREHRPRPVEVFRIRNRLLIGYLKWTLVYETLVTNVLIGYILGTRLQLTTENPKNVSH